MTKHPVNLRSAQSLIKIVGLLAYLTLLVLVVITYEHHAAAPISSDSYYLTTQLPTINTMY